MSNKAKSRRVIATIRLDGKTKMALFAFESVLVSDEPTIAEGRKVKKAHPSPMVGSVKERRKLFSTDVSVVLLFRDAPVPRNRLVVYYNEPVGKTTSFRINQPDTCQLAVAAFFPAIRPKVRASATEDPLPTYQP